MKIKCFSSKLISNPQKFTIPSKNQTKALTFAATRPLICAISHINTAPQRSAICRILPKSDPLGYELPRRSTPSGENPPASLQASHTSHSQCTLSAGSPYTENSQRISKTLKEYQSPRHLLPTRRIIFTAHVPAGRRIKPHYPIIRVQ